MDIIVYVHAASDLKNVNWRHGSLEAYAVAWIDSSVKCSTKSDLANGVNPFWDEKFTIALPATSDPETAILYIDIVHANYTSDTKPLVGSAKLPLRVALDKATSKGKAWFDLILERPSGRPQGNLKIKIKVNGSDISKREAHRQKAHMSSGTPPQPQPQPQPYYQYQAPGYASIIEDIQSTARASESLDAAYAKARLAARGRIYALDLI